MNLRVYVAAPFARRAEVRDMHLRLQALAIHGTSSWTYVDGEGPERLTREVAAEAIAGNRVDILRSHAMLVLGYYGEGREMFAEVARAQAARLPIVWVGSRCLSGWDEGVVHFDDEEQPREHAVNDAVDLLRECAIRCELLHDDVRIVRATLGHWLSQRGRPSVPSLQSAAEGSAQVLAALDDVGRRKGAA